MSLCSAAVTVAVIAFVLAAALGLMIYYVHVRHPQMCPRWPLKPLPPAKADAELGEQRPKPEGPQQTSLGRTSRKAFAQLVCATGQDSRGVCFHVCCDALSSSEAVSCDHESSMRSATVCAVRAVLISSSVCLPSHHTCSVCDETHAPCCSVIQRERLQVVDSL